MAQVRSIPVAGEEYDKDDEDQFRRSLRESLDSLLSGLNSVASLQDSQASLATKRMSFSPPVGLLEYT